MLYFILSEKEADPARECEKLLDEELKEALMLPTGPISQKCWNQGYDSAEKVMEDLKMVMEQEGIDVEEMEMLDAGGAMDGLLDVFNPPAEQNPRRW